MSVAGQSVHHKTSFYIIIWVALLLMLGMSIPLGIEGHSTLATALIFSIATLKAYLVLVYYMGLSYEPRYIAGILIVGFLFVAILFVALIPDMVHIYGRI